MKRGLLIIFSIAISVLAGCTRDDNSEFTDTPVIESYLRPGDCVNLKVSRQIPFSSDVNYSADDINNLVITVKNRGISHILTPIGDGIYADSSLIVAEGERYDLSFKYNSKNVSAYTEIPLKPEGFTESAKSISVMRMDSTSVPTGGGRWEMMQPLTLKWTNDDGSYYIVVIENMEATLDPVRNFGTTNVPFGRFRKSPTTASGIEMRPQEFQYFGHHRIILNHVLPDYASLYKETTSSSQNLTNPSSSIVNGYGIFTGLSSDTLYLFVAELKK
jgi:hypothetical protein